MTSETRIPTPPVVTSVQSDNAIIQAEQEVRTPVRVAIACPGIGRTLRGFERALLDTYSSLCHRPELEISLYGGATVSGYPVRRTPSLCRDAWIARAAASLTGRDAYFWEKVSFASTLHAQLRREPPDVVYYTDITVGNILRRIGKYLGRPYSLLYLNGGMTPPEYLGGDLNQQVTEPAYRGSLAALGTDNKLCFVPHGLIFHDSRQSAQSVTQRRSALDIPLSRKVVLSVGKIDCAIKRMDYLVREVAQLPKPRPFLMMLGQTCGETRHIEVEATELLGKRGVDFDIRSVPFDKVGDFYGAADVFALASLSEGFGLVYAESLSWGLPTLCHKHPVTDYVVGRAAESADLRQPGALARLIETSLDEPLDSPQRKVRQEEIRRKFDWRNLEDDYIAMFQRAALMSPQAGSAPSQGRGGQSK